jgi:predicted peptidase
VISPQLRSGVGNWLPDIQKELYSHLLSTYRIDKTRIYLTGLSLGGWGVYNGLSQAQDIFAAGLVLAGSKNSSSCEIAKRLIPLWAIHGEKDNTTQFTYGDGWTEFMRIKWCADDLKITLPEQRWTKVLNAGHDVWTQYYNDTSVYEWLLSKKKGVITAPIEDLPIPIIPPPVPKSTITIDGKVYEITLTLKN